MGRLFLSVLGTLVLLSLLVLAGFTGCGHTPVSLTTFDQTSASVTSENGLSITLSIDSTTYKSGEQVSVTIDEKNTLAKDNNVPAAALWPAQRLTLDACGTLWYPFGVSILQGYYDITNVTTITPLQSLYDPSAAYSCPVVGPITYYDFQPSSDNAVIVGFDYPPETTTITDTVKTAGFWTGSQYPATFHNFNRGIYTVVGGDEWGALVILHFVVA